MLIDGSVYYMLPYLLLPGLWLLFKKSMLGPRVGNQDCKMMVRPAVFVLVTRLVLPAIEWQ